MMLMSNRNGGFYVMGNGVWYRMGHFHWVRTINGDLDRLRYTNVVGFGNFNSVRDGNGNGNVFSHRYMIRVGYLHLHMVIYSFHRYVAV